MHGQQVLCSPDGSVWFLEGGNVFGGEWRVGRTLEGRSEKECKELKVTCHVTPS